MQFINKYVDYLVLVYMF